jgi:hypothetical protein
MLPALVSFSHEVCAYQVGEFAGGMQFQVRHTWLWTHGQIHHGHFVSTLKSRTTSLTLCTVRRSANHEWQVCAHLRLG